MINILRAAAFLLLAASSALASSIGGQPFTHSAFFASSGTFTVPSGVYVLYTNACSAGGSGGQTTSGGNYGAAGASGGQSLIGYPLMVTPGQTLTVTVGVDTTYAAGGVTSVSGTAISFPIIAGGVTPTTGTSQTAGTVPAPDTAGGASPAAYTYANVIGFLYGGAGGGNGVSSGTGVAGGSTVAFAGGTATSYGGGGGASMFGPGGAGGAVNSAGSQPPGYCGGGGGASQNGGSGPFLPGSGAPGFVEFQW